MTYFKELLIKYQILRGKQLSIENNWENRNLDDGTYILPEELLLEMEKETNSKDLPFNQEYAKDLLELMIVMCISLKVNNTLFYWDHRVTRFKVKNLVTNEETVCPNIVGNYEKYINKIAEDLNKCDDYITFEASPCRQF